MVTLSASATASDSWPKTGASGDFLLSTTNPLTADHFKNKSGRERVTASWDLNFQQFEDPLRAEITTVPLWRELTLFSQLGVTRGQIAKEARPAADAAIKLAREW